MSAVGVTKIGHQSFHKRSLGFDVDQCADCNPVVGITSASFCQTGMCYFIMFS
jgi:hypothetical protein